MAYATDAEEAAEEPRSASSWPKLTRLENWMKLPRSLPAFASLAFLAGLVEAFGTCFVRARETPFHCV